MLTLISPSGICPKKRATEFKVSDILVPVSPSGTGNTFLEEGYRSLERTPEILPVLKQAGVVDAGAKGLLTFVEGMLTGLTGQLDFAAENKIIKSSALGFIVWPPVMT